MAESEHWLTMMTRWTSRVAGRMPSAARRPVLWGASYPGDLALAAVFTIAAVVTVVRGYLRVGRNPRPEFLGVTHALPHPAHALPPVTPWVMLGVVLATAPLAFRRTYPTSAFCVVMVGFIASTSRATSVTVAAVIFAAYSAVAHYGRYRWTTLFALLAGAVVITVADQGTTGQIPARYTPLLVLLPTAALGNMTRTWRLRASESAERLRLAQAAHEAETRHAVETERARIASELHDVVTHNVSVMVVQAGAARRALESSAAETGQAAAALPGGGTLPGGGNLPAGEGLAREALLAVEAGGRTAMTELRHLLGLLAPAGDAAAASAVGTEPEAGAAAGALRPQPGVDQVPALIDRVRAAGVDAGLSVTGTVRALPPGLDLAAFRVIQEALTNVLKHAGQARTAVRIEYRPDELRITVSDDGRPADAGPPPVQPHGQGGRGLLGLRERIAIYSGELYAGPRPGGGWRVSATIPLEPAADATEGLRPRFQAAPS